MNLRRGKQVGVVHATLNPDGPGVVRLHLVPPKNSDVPHILFINGYQIIPLSESEAWLTRLFIEELTAKAPQGEELSNEFIDQILETVANKMSRLYPKIAKNRFKADVVKLVDAFFCFARGENPGVNLPFVSLQDYVEQMTGPHRMDLIISPMERNGHHACPLNCLNCYAKQSAMSVEASEELSTLQWKQIVDRCREAGVVQITFTGGEPTTRADLVKLIAYAKELITRLNTSGVTLTTKLAKELYEASLDSVQFTLYSQFAYVHDQLVGREGAWLKTIQGIFNALEAGLNVSVNTPLCSANREYVGLLSLLKELGITYVSCSGLIPTGGAVKSLQNDGALSSDELFAILEKAQEFCAQNEMELAFTSPGWISEEKLASLGLPVPTCGACTSNMAITPTGAVVPCQSWLSDPKGLGNMLTTPWEQIWNSQKCQAIRNQKLDNTCPLKEL